MVDVITKLLTYSGLNAKQFSEKIGLDRPQAIYDLLSGKTKGISANMRSKILSRYPLLNQNWLLTGEGEMLRGGSTVVANNSGITAVNNTGRITDNDLSADISNTTKALDALASSQKMHEKTQEQLSKLQEQFDRLLDIFQNFVGK